MDLTARVNGSRFWGTVERSAEIGATSDGGLDRQTLTPADKQMRDLFVGWCADAGLEISTDPLGSIFARRAGRDNNLPPVVMGSHLDSQENGGRYDGILGVLAALEVIRTLNDIGHITRRPLEIVNWTNEEGCRFSPPMLASGCFADAYSIDWVYQRQDQAGTTFKQALDALDIAGTAPLGRKFDCYFELHIEQGSRLDDTGVKVGVVTHGYHSNRVVVQFFGEAGHTGTAPMGTRRSAMVAAAHLAVKLDQIGLRFSDTGGMATAGQILALPNRAGVITPWSQVVCDVRHDDMGTEQEMLRELEQAIEEAAALGRCQFKIVDNWKWGGELFDGGLVDLIKTSCEKLDFPYLTLPSLAAHDAYFVASTCPAAMIFTPCRAGVTHNPNEFTTCEDSLPGVNVLLHSAVRRADR